MVLIGITCTNNFKIYFSNSSFQRIKPCFKSRNHIFRLKHLCIKEFSFHVFVQMNLIVILGWIRISMRIFLILALSKAMIDQTSIRPCFIGIYIMMECSQNWVLGTFLYTGGTQASLSVHLEQLFQVNFLIFNYISVSL